MVCESHHHGQEELLFSDMVSIGIFHNLTTCGGGGASGSVLCVCMHLCVLMCVLCMYCECVM